MKIKLKPVAKEDYAFLFELLKERTPEQTISFVMPTWDQHLWYIANKPYQEWCIISLNGLKIGNIYLARDGSMGYFLKKEYIGKGYGTLAIKEMVKRNPREYYYANVNPDNITGVNLAKYKFKGELVKQVSYKISRENILNC